MALLPDNLSTLACAGCGHAMDLVRTIPRLGVLPKLFVFQCPSCHDVAANEGSAAGIERQQNRGPAFALAEARLGLTDSSGPVLRS